jgi:hypothetical protein
MRSGGFWLLATLISVLHLRFRRSQQNFTPIGHKSRHDISNNDQWHPDDAAQFQRFRRTETVEHFSGAQPDDKQRTLQETAGIPTGVAFDIQIELLRAGMGVMSCQRIVASMQDGSQKFSFVRCLKSLNGFCRCLSILL